MLDRRSVRMMTGRSVCLSVCVSVCVGDVSCVLTDAGGDAGPSLGAHDDGQVRRGVDGGAGHALAQGARVLATLVQQQVEDGTVVVVLVRLHRLHRQRQARGVKETVNTFIERDNKDLLYCIVLHCIVCIVLYCKVRLH